MCIQSLFGEILVQMSSVFLFAPKGNRFSYGLICRQSLQLCFSAEFVFDLALSCEFADSDPDRYADEIRVIEDGVFEVDGDTVVSELCSLMDWDEESFDFESETVGGWCIEFLDGFPEEGTSFEYRNTQITVTEADDRRVKKVTVRIRQEESQEE